MDWEGLLADVEQWREEAQAALSRTVRDAQDGLRVSLPDFTRISNANCLLAGVAAVAKSAIMDYQYTTLEAHNADATP